VLLVAPAKQDPVPRAGRRDHDQRRGGGHQREEIVALLEARELLELRLEGDREQEAEQDLHAGLDHSGFLQELDQVAVGALELCLVAAVVHTYVLPVGSTLTTTPRDIAAFVTFRASGNDRRLQSNHLPVVERRVEAGPRSGRLRHKETGPLGTGRLRASGEEVLL